MTPSLRVIESEGENCVRSAEIPRAQPSQYSLLKLTVHSGPTVQFNRRKKFTERAFESFLEVAPDAVVVADQDGRIIRVNAQTERMFQYSRAELLGRQIEVMIHRTLRAFSEHSELLGGRRREPS